MGEPDSDPPQHGESDADPPLTVDLLADLQAGLLDDEAAARVRSRVRADPEAEDIMRALNRVRTDLAAAGADSTSITEAPPVDTAPPRSSGAAHSARPPIRPGRLIAGIVGLGALVVAIGLGTSALLNAPRQRRAHRPPRTTSRCQGLPPDLRPRSRSHTPKSSNCSTTAPTTAHTALSRNRRGGHRACAASAIRHPRRSWAHGRSR